MPLNCCSFTVDGPQKQLAIDFTPASHKHGTALLSIKTDQKAQRQSVQCRPPEQRTPPKKPLVHVTQRLHVAVALCCSSTPSVASALVSSSARTAPTSSSADSFWAVASSFFSGTPTADSPRRFFAASSLYTGTHARANTMTMFMSFMTTRGLKKLEGCHTLQSAGAFRAKWTSAHDTYIGNLHRCINLVTFSNAALRCIKQLCGYKQVSYMSTQSGN